MLIDLNESLRANPYPGRGILLGRSADGGKAVIAIFHHGPQREQPQPHL
jgi:hypothetical protein